MMRTAAIDWDQVRERLRSSEQALTNVLAENPERVQAAYRKRAAQLAETQAPGPAKGAGIPALVFSLAQERYAIELSELAEVLPLGRCEPVPGAAAHFLGVINLRGEVRPIVDLSRMILQNGNGAAAHGFLLMLRRQGREIGLKVDRLDGLREIEREKVGAVEQGKFTRGIAGDTILWLDVEKVLAKVFT